LQLITHYIILQRITHYKKFKEFYKLQLITHYIILQRITHYIILQRITHYKKFKGFKDMKNNILIIMIIII